MIQDNSYIIIDEETNFISIIEHKSEMPLFKAPISKSISKKNKLIQNVEKLISELRDMSYKI